MHTGDEAQARCCDCGASCCAVVIELIVVVCVVPLDSDVFMLPRSCISSKKKPPGLGAVADICYTAFIPPPPKPLSLAANKHEYVDYDNKAEGGNAILNCGHHVCLKMHEITQLSVTIIHKRVKAIYRKEHKTLKVRPTCPYLAVRIAQLYTSTCCDLAITTPLGGTQTVLCSHVAGSFSNLHILHTLCYGEVETGE